MLAPPGHAQTITSSTTFNLAPGQLQAESAQITGAPTAITITGGGELVLTNPANSYGGGTVVNDGSAVQVGVAGELGAATGTLTLGDATNSGTLDLSTTTGNVGSFNPIVLEPGGGVIETGPNGSWTLAGPISGSGGLTVIGAATGSGNVGLAGNNTYTGGTNLTAGVLTVESPTGLGSGGTLAISNGSTLVFQSGGTFDQAGNISGYNTISVAPGQTASLTGPIADGSSPGQINLVGGGTLALSNGANSFSGGTIITGGSTLAVNSDAALGAGSGSTGVVQIGNGITLGTLDLTPSTGPVTSQRNFFIGATGGTILVGPNAPWTLSGAVSGGGLVVSGGGELFLDNAGNAPSAIYIEGNSAVGATSEANLGVNEGPIFLGGSTANSGTGTLDFSQTTTAVSSLRNINLNPGGGIIEVGPTAAWTLGGVVQGSGGLTITSSGSGGTLTLTNVNTYTGTTTVIGGAVLAVSSDLNLGGANDLNSTDTDTPGCICTITTSNGIVLGNASTQGNLSLTGVATSARPIDLGSAGGGIDINGALWTFTAPVSGSGGLSVTGDGGELVFDNTETYTGGTTISGGTLMVGDDATPSASLMGNVTLNGGTLSGYGSIPGAVVNNSGTVTPGGESKVGALTVGSFTQGSAGTTSIEVTPGGASVLDVTGKASLAGTLNLAYSGNFGNETLPLINAASVTGTFSAVTGAASVAIGQTVIYTPTEVELVLDQLALPENPTIYPALTSVAVDAAQSDNGTIMARLSELPTEAMVDDMSMAESTYHRSGLSPGKSPYGPWMEALGGAGTTSGSGSAPGYNTRGAGFVGGVDFEMKPGVVGGVGLSYSLSRVSVSGGGYADIDTPRVFIYGGVWRGPYIFDGSVGIGYASLDTSRPIVATGASAGALFNATELTSAFQAGRPFQLGRFAITPSAGVEYAYVNESRAGETGGGSYDLTVLQDTTNSVRPFLAATIATRIDWGEHAAVEPEFRLSYSEEVAGNGNTALVQPVDDTQTFEVPGVTPSRGMFTASAGVKIETDRDLAFFADVDGTESGTSRGIGANAGIRYRF